MSKRKQQSAPAGFEIEVDVLRVERIANTRDGNPKYRLHAAEGVYTTADNTQSAHALTGDEIGPMALLIEGSRVIGWRVLPRG